MTGRNSVLLLGQEATEHNFKTQPLSDFKMIHMAVHALGETVFRNVQLWCSQEIPIRRMMACCR